MLIVIPMAGMSERFVKVGFGPKHGLPLAGHTIFDWVVSGFGNYPHANFLFSTANTSVTAFVYEHASKLSIRHFQTIEDGRQFGYGFAAFNTLEASNQNKDQPLIISPIDTYRPNFLLPKDIYNKSFMELCIAGSPTKERLDGNARKPMLQEEPPPGSSCLVKTNILHLMGRRSTGLYYFEKAWHFTEAFRHARERHQTSGQNKRREIFEWYRTLQIIRRNHPLAMHLVNRTDVIFSGNPREYVFIRNNWPKRFSLAPQQFLKATL